MGTTRERVQALVFDGTEKDMNLLRKALKRMLRTDPELASLSVNRVVIQPLGRMVKNSDLSEDGKAHTVIMNGK